MKPSPLKLILTDMPPETPGSPPVVGFVLPLETLLQHFEFQLVPKQGLQAPLQPVTECEQALLDVVGDSPRRMTTNEILAALARADLNHGESTVKLALAKLVREKQLTNASDERGRGYALST